MNIMIISGSTRKSSSTRNLSLYVQKQLVNEYKCDASLFDLGEDLCPLYTGEEDCFKSVAVKKLNKNVEKANAFIICTPVYHSSISGSLKNTLDYLDKRYIERKPSAIMAVSGGDHAGVEALTHLRTILRSLHSLVIPDQVSVNPKNFNPYGEWKDKRSHNKVEGMITNLIDITKKME